MAVNFKRLADKYRAGMRWTDASIKDQFVILIGSITRQDSWAVLHHRAWLLRSLKGLLNRLGRDLEGFANNLQLKTLNNCCHLVQGAAKKVHREANHSYQFTHDEFKLALEKMHQAHMMYDGFSRTLDSLLQQSLYLAITKSGIKL